MPRLLGVDIPNDKQIVYSLQYLYGVGPSIAREACVKTKINPTKRARELDEDELSRLASLLNATTRSKVHFEGKWVSRFIDCEKSSATVG